MSWAYCRSKHSVNVANGGFAAIAYKIVGGA